MTLEQTRQLGIEFERRIQTILPSTKTVDKIDTEDIYAFLNEYQNQFIKELYITKDRVQPNSNASNRIDDYLKTLIVWGECIPDEYNLFKLDDFNMYIDSTSLIEGSYAKPYDEEDSQTQVWVGNDYINSQQYNKIMRDPYNKGKILRRPLLVMKNAGKGTTFEVITDEYTKVIAIDIRYIKIPTNFTILGDGVACELPYECFNELVNGAVQLFINYKRGGISQPQTASKQPQRQSNQQNNQRDEQEDEE